MLFLVVINVKFLLFFGLSVLIVLHLSIFLAARHRLLWKVIHAVLLSCIEITVCQCLCSSCSQSSVKASVRVSPLIKLFAQVAHFAVTSSNCECEKTAFSQCVTFGCRSADCHSHLCSLSCLGKIPRIDFGWLETPRINIQQQESFIQVFIISQWCLKVMDI